LSRILKIETPISESQVRDWKIGDVVYLTGTIITARDQAHKRMVKFLEEHKGMPFNLKGLAIYHCGPIVKRLNSEWIVISAGPTTSMRMERFEDKIIRSLNVRLIIGKGGMSAKTGEAMKEYGAAYGAFTGGAAVLAARLIKRVRQVEWLDLGMPEAIWVFEVENFGPLIISIDARGGNLFEEIRFRAEKNMNRIIS